MILPIHVQKTLAELNAKFDVEEMGRFWDLNECAMHNIIMVMSRLTELYAPRYYLSTTYEEDSIVVTVISNLISYEEIDEVLDSIGMSAEEEAPMCFLPFRELEDNAS